MSVDIVESPVTFVNLTPHPVILAGQILPSAGQARCQEYTAATQAVDGVLLIRRGYTSVEGLPGPKPGTIYIVSMLVRMVLPRRLDLASPGQVERDERGQVTAAHSLVLNVP